MSKDDKVVPMPDVDHRTAEEIKRVYGDGCFVASKGFCIQGSQKGGPWSDTMEWCEAYPVYQGNPEEKPKMVGGVRLLVDKFLHEDGWGPAQRRFQEVMTVEVYEAEKKKCREALQQAQIKARQAQKG